MRFLSKATLRVLCAGSCTALPLPDQLPPFPLSPFPLFPAIRYVGVTRVGWASVIYFVSLVLVGTYIVLNLFLGILIDNFRQDDDDDVDAEAGIVAQAREEIKKVRPAPLSCTQHTRRVGLALGFACPTPSSHPRVPPRPTPPQRLDRSTSFEEDGAGMALYMQGGHVHNVVMRRALARLASQRRMEAEEEALKLTRFEDHRSFKWKSLWGIRGNQPLRLCVAAWYGCMAAPPPSPLLSPPPAAV